MSDEQVQKLALLVATMEERVEGMKERDAEHSAKLDKLFGVLVKANSDREADMFTLKMSIKKKISESVGELKNYHDIDMDSIRKDVKVSAWLGRNKKVMFIAMFLLLFSCWQQVVNIVNHHAEQQGLKPVEPKIISHTTK
jgi:PleD family two-component response regulator